MKQSVDQPTPSYRKKYALFGMIIGGIGCLFVSVFLLLLKLMGSMASALPPSLTIAQLFSLARFFFVLLLGGATFGWIIGGVRDHFSRNES